MEKKFLALFFAAAIAMVVLSGCTSGSNNSINSIADKNKLFGNREPAAAGTGTGDVSGEEIVVTVKGKPDPVLVDNNIRYIIEVRNNGPEEITDLSLSFTVSSELDIVSATGEHEKNLNKVSWEISAIAPMEFEKREVIAQANEAGYALVSAKLKAPFISNTITVTEETEIEE